MNSNPVKQNYLRFPTPTPPGSNAAILFRFCYEYIQEDMRGVRLLALGTGCTMHHSARDSKRRQPDVPTDLVMTVKPILRGGPIKYRQRPTCRNVPVATLWVSKKSVRIGTSSSPCVDRYIQDNAPTVYIFTPKNAIDEWSYGMFRTCPAKHCTCCRHMTTLNAFGAALINRFGYFRK